MKTCTSNSSQNWSYIETLVSEFAGFFWGGGGLACCLRKKTLFHWGRRFRWLCGRVWGTLSECAGIWTSSGRVNGHWPELPKRKNLVTPWKLYMSPEKAEWGPFWKSSNHLFSRDMLVLRGVLLVIHNDGIIFRIWHPINQWALQKKQVNYWLVIWATHCLKFCWEFLLTQPF